MIRSRFHGPSFLGLALGCALLAQEAKGPEPPATKTRHAALDWTAQQIHALEVSDLRRSINWYRKTLGFELALDYVELGWAELSTPNAGIALGLGKPAAGSERRTNGGGSIGLGVRDVEAARAHLVALGVDCDEIQTIPDIVELLSFRDPDGNALFLFQSLEAAR